MQYSVIIPTMWASDCLEKSIETYNNCSLVYEIILIDNNPKEKRKLESPKVKIYSQDKNIYVNPAWNLGVKVAKKDKIIIANDDITIDDGVIENIDLKDGEIIGADMGRDMWGFGVFMVMNKKDYVVIPDELKIWFGDNIQINANKPRQIKGIHTEMNTTIKKINCDHIIENDKKIWKTLHS